MSHDYKSGDTGNDILSEYLDGDEGLAKVLDKCPRTIKRWRALGEGPAYTRMGRNILYHVDDVREWLRSRRVEPDGL